MKKRDNIVVNGAFRQHDQQSQVAVAGPEVLIFHPAFDTTNGAEAARGGHCLGEVLELMDNNGLLCEVLPLPEGSVADFTNELKEQLAVRQSANTVVMTDDCRRLEARKIQAQVGSIQDEVGPWAYEQGRTVQVFKAIHGYDDLAGIMWSPSPDETSTFRLPGDPSLEVRPLHSSG